MSRKRSIWMALTALVLVTGSVLFAGCRNEPAADPAEAAVTPAAAAAVGPESSVVAPSPAAAEAAAATAAGSGLTAEQVEGLYWMREEEKLARDVYLAMFDLWGLGTFESIAASEARHMEAVLGLIEAYDLEDPVTDDTPGVFSDPELAALYRDLVERGSGSLGDALIVGATIEDLDILDLEEELEITDQADIRRVYENLLRGSVNHLRAFTTRLEAEGAEYEAVYHTPEELAALLAEAGGAGGRRRGR